MNTTLVPIRTNHIVVLVRTLRSNLALKEQPVPFSSVTAAVIDINGGQRLHQLAEIR